LTQVDTRLETPIHAKFWSQAAFLFTTRTLISADGCNFDPVKKILAFSWAMGLALLAICQPPEFEAPRGMSPRGKKTRNGGFGYFSMGFTSMNIDALNQRMGSYGYPSLNAAGFTTGGGGFAVIKNVLIGGEGWAMDGGNVKGNGFTSTFSSAGGIFMMGYVFGSKKFTLYPLLGFGGGGMQVKMRPDLAALPFDSVLSNPGRGVDISGGSPVITFGLGSEFRTGSKVPGYFFGFQAGMIQGLGNMVWNTNETRLNDGPVMQQQGWFVRLKIGAGLY
jgi:hypothetical protein